MFSRMSDGSDARTTGSDLRAKLVGAADCKKGVLVLSGRMETEVFGRSLEVFHPEIDSAFISRHVVASVLPAISLASQVRKEMYTESYISE